MLSVTGRGATAITLSATMSMAVLSRYGKSNHPSLKHISNVSLSNGSSAARLNIHPIINRTTITMKHETYMRVIPRDLFNEAKLLKCVGRLCLLIHNGTGIEGMAFDHDDEPFDIELLDAGYLQIGNIRFTLRDHTIAIIAQYNSKEQYPLYLYYDYCEYRVFDEAGNFEPEFVEFCKTLNQ